MSVVVPFVGNVKYGIVVKCGVKSNAVVAVVVVGAMAVVANGN